MLSTPQGPLWGANVFLTLTCLENWKAVHQDWPHVFLISPSSSTLVWQLHDLPLAMLAAQLRFAP